MEEEAEAVGLAEAVEALDELLGAVLLQVEGRGAAREEGLDGGVLEGLRAKKTFSLGSAANLKNADCIEHLVDVI